MTWWTLISQELSNRICFRSESHGWQLITEPPVTIGTDISQIYWSSSLTELPLPFANSGACCTNNIVCSIAFDKLWKQARSSVHNQWLSEGNARTCFQKAAIKMTFLIILELYLYFIAWFLTNQWFVYVILLVSGITHRTQFGCYGIWKHQSPQSERRTYWFRQSILKIILVTHCKPNKKSLKKSYNIVKTIRYVRSMSVYVRFVLFLSILSGLSGLSVLSVSVFGFC